jgi:hypothetical protein
MKIYQQYDTFELVVDLNPVIKKGLQGVILEIWDEQTYEVEFVDKDGINLEFEGIATFTVNISFIKIYDSLK